MTDTNNIVKHPAVADESILEARLDSRTNTTARVSDDAVSETILGETEIDRRRLIRRKAGFALLPIALLIGGYFYITGGRYMSTDNAYVQADMVGVSTDVSGLVTSISVRENELVRKGQVLFSLRPDSFLIAVAGAKAELENTRNKIISLKAEYQKSLTATKQAEINIPYYETIFKRQQNLVASHTTSHAIFDQAQHDMDAARQMVSVAKADAQLALSQLGGDVNQPVEQNPLYQEAKTKVDEAQRQLDHSVVRAPFDGVVTNVNSLQVGSYLQASQQAFSLVSSNNVWIAANPKETELTNIQPGQKVAISVDTYPGIQWEGIVSSISPASGSSFSLLPAQNTSGNWIKVVQRIPIRVAINSTDSKPILRIGMSANLEVDTGHSRGLPSFITNIF
ncbi:HlyD family secretion protein [Pseudochrobactrum kiredjianiae]|uniref:HlyD family secretion protein n=1 Tax=Pseudochrobactrum kiredjianiae TaxID=386305 RepID=A0ABW3V6A0_9HYPH|nr:HlyD family secretion protein [Pseudochrobactrum kiredjianiae]MDM7852995.1 HlyD family secretion protein [Pseudochrobactrum kiredjianiae]